MFRSMLPKKQSNVEFMRASGLISLPRVEIYVGMTYGSVIEHDVGLQPYLGYETDQLWVQDAARDFDKWDWMDYSGENVLVLDGFDPVQNIIPMRKVQDVVNGDKDVIRVNTLIEPGWTKVWICTSVPPWDWYSKEFWDVMKWEWIVNVWREHVSGEMVPMNEPGSVIECTFGDRSEFMKCMKFMA